MAKKRASSSHPAIARELGSLLYWISVGDSLAVCAEIEKATKLVNAVHPSGTTPLFFAVRHQMEYITEYLLEQDANPNPELPGRVSLCEMADELPSEEILEQLVSAGAKKKSAKQLKSETKPVYPNIKSLSKAELPLCAAVHDPAQFRKLVGKIPQKRRQALLSAACEEREVEFGLRLLEHVDKPDFARDDAENPLGQAAESGCLPLVEALLDRGAKKYAHMAFFAAQANGHLDVCQALLPAAEKHATFAVHVGEAAQFAAQDGYTELAEWLMQFADKTITARANKAIRKWRSEYDGDEYPRYFSQGGDEPIGLDEEEDEEEKPWTMSGDDVKFFIKQLADNHVGDLLTTMMLIRGFVNDSGADFSGALPKLKKLAKHKNQRIVKGAASTIKAIEKHEG